jgi:hypothetical protein
MKSAPSSYAVFSARSRSAVPAASWSLVLVVVAEFKKAVVAAHRYERLKYLALKSNDAAATTARRIYMEFYSDS